MPAALLPGRAGELARGPPLVPCCRAGYVHACSAIQLPLASVDSAVPPTDGDRRQRGERVQADVGLVGGVAEVLAALALQPAGVARRTTNTDVPCAFGLCSASSHRLQVGRREQRLAAAAERDAPDRAGVLAVDGLVHARQSRRRASANDFAYVRASNTTSFASGTIACATSRSIGVSRSGSPGEPLASSGGSSAARRRRVRVEVALLEPVELEEHDRLALAGVSLRDQRAGVVRAQQLGRR